MKLKYFLPDWEDRLDPDFNFATDKYSKKHDADPYNYDFYAHQLFDKPPYDGILFSLSVFQSKITLKNGDNETYTIRNHTNIRDYLKIPKDSSLKVMGDCGAFGYVKEKAPPLPFYSVENVSNIYDKLGFDYGVSVDHLVVDYVMVRDEITGKKLKNILSRDEKDERIEITLKNAKKFLKLHNKKKYNFIPIGVAQGYDTDTYRESVKSLIEMGYKYIALGGLVQYKSDFIIGILTEIQPFIKGINVHLFGVLRPGHLNDFESFGVTSFDSASFLRKAWLRSGQNYLAPNGKWYAAIRVPQATNPRLLKHANLNGFSIDDLIKMEQDALRALIKYDKGKINVDDTLDIILKYDNLLLRDSNDGENLKEKYERTLLDRPWKSCSCNVCKKIGIHVIIFRGTNRNKRRGFHNTWIFREVAEIINFNKREENADL
ncbi:Queuine tRNA-ribosyltransferase [uncultured archaeon]|nr:Queuine tRNA-ribosyltransferase [uncultured archaeon]